MLVSISEPTDIFGAIRTESSPHFAAADSYLEFIYFRLFTIFVVVIERWERGAKKGEQ